MLLLPLSSCGVNLVVPGVGLASALVTSSRFGQRDASLVPSRAGRDKMCNCLSADKKGGKIGVGGGIYARAQQRRIWTAVNSAQE